MKFQTAETKLTLDRLINYSGQEATSRTTVLRINLPILKVGVGTFKVGDRFRMAVLDLYERTLAFFDLRGTEPVLVVTIPTNFYSTSIDLTNEFEAEFS